MTDISFDTCKCGAVIVSSATAVAGLKAEADRLRAALEEIVAEDDAAACCGKGRGYGDQLECCGDPEYGIDRAQRIARAALTAQPAEGEK